MPSPTVKTILGTFTFLPRTSRGSLGGPPECGAFLQKIGENSPDKETLRGGATERVVVRKDRPEQLIFSRGVPFSSPPALDNILLSTLIH